MQSENTQVEQFNIAKNQSLPASWSDQVRSYYVIKGMALVKISNEESLVLEEFDLINIQNDIIVSFEAYKSDLILLCIMSNSSKDVNWESR